MSVTLVDPSDTVSVKTRSSDVSTDGASKLGASVVEFERVTEVPDVCAQLYVRASPSLSEAVPLRDTESATADIWSDPALMTGALLTVPEPPFELEELEPDPPHAARTAALMSKSDRESGVIFFDFDWRFSVYPSY
mgnify:CR=1 FL=1